MSVREEKPADLSAIAAPSEPPPREPDALTRREKENYERAPKATPTQQLIAEKDKHIRDLCVERDRLIVERDSFREERDRQSAQMMRLTGANATLRQQVHDSRSVFGFSALATLVGGTAISFAGAISDPFWKPASLVGGAAVFVFGFALALWSIFFVGRSGGKDNDQD